MTALSQLIERGFAVKLERQRLYVSPASMLTDCDRAFIRANKLRLIGELERRRRRDNVLMQLASNPAVRYAYAIDAGRDPVVVAVGIRDLATFELTIRADRFDGLKLLRFLEESQGVCEDWTGGLDNGTVATR